MITLNSADGALKSFYLDAVAESLNMKVNPFLAKVEKTSNYVAGKDVRKTVRVGMNGGIGAGTETGALPSARDPKFMQLTATLKNLYGTIEISDKALRSAQSDEGAFVNLLNDEMQALVKSASFNFGRMLFGDGTGRLGTVESVTATDVKVTNIQNFTVGMYVDVEDGPAEYQNIRVAAVDYANKTIRLDKSSAPSEDIVDLDFVAHGSAEHELTGLGAIFSNAPLYGVSRSEMGMTPYMAKAFGAFTEEKVQKVVDEIEANSGHNVDMILCSWGVRRAIKEYYRQNNIALKTVQLEGGYNAIEVMGIPVVVDRFCPEGTMYLLTSDCFKLCQLCDWQWLEAEDGKILKQVPGKPVYTATLVKYAELLCENPSAQARLTGVTEA